MEKQFIKAMLIRAVRTVCQSAIALIPAQALLTEVDWKLIASASILAGIVSILTSIATGLPEVDYEKHFYMNVEPPEDAEVTDDEDC